MEMKKSLLLFFSFITLALAAQDVVQWRGDRTGVYKNETGLLKAWPEGGPRLLWCNEELGDGYSSVTIHGDRIYTTGMVDGKGYLYVLGTDGKLIGKKEYADEWTGSYPSARGTVAIDSGRLYLISGIGEIICLDEKTLDIVWKRSFRDDFGGDPPRHGVYEFPLIVGEKLIATPGGKKDNVVALDKNTGKLIWSSVAKGDVSSYCSAIYLDDQEIPQVVTMTGDHVIGLDIENGELIWSHPFTNRFKEHPNTPVYSDNMLLCTSSYGVGSIMLRLTGGGRKVEEVWKSVDLDARTGHMIKLGDYAYGAGDYGKGSWYCVDWHTGRQMYKDRTIATGAIIAADGMLYCYSEKGDLALVKAVPDKFDIVSRFSINKGTGQHWAHPVIFRGVLYVRHGDSLMAYKIR